MNVALEQHMEAEKMPEEKRNVLRRQAQHSSSRYNLTGEHLQHPFDKENLLSVLMTMDRYLIDSNLPGSLADAKKPANRNKAFILGQTFTDERENLAGAIFGPGIDNSNNNLFNFGMEECHGVPCLTISRLDAHLRTIMDAGLLRSESRQRNKRLKDDPEFIGRDRKHLTDVLQLKQFILTELLGVSDIISLPPSQRTGRKKAIVQIIRSKTSACFSNYFNSVEVAQLCYAALLVESDGVGRKTRDEFCHPDRRNVFGDTRLIQNALWLNSHILSNDQAVCRMIKYTGLAELKVIDKIGNPLTLLLSRFLQRVRRAVRQLRKS